MALQFLIDDLMRQSMVMIARLATAGGARAPLAHMRDQIFLDLTEQLRGAGLGHKVIADMFSMSLRAYYSKLKTLEQSQYFRNRTLWQAVVDYLLDKRVAERTEIFHRFRNDDRNSLVGIMNDLVTSGWVYRKGDGDQVVYRIVDPDDHRANDAERLEGLCSLVWIHVRRHGPLDLEALRAHVPGTPPEHLQEALDRLVDRKKIQRKTSNGSIQYAATAFVPAHQRDQASSWVGAISHHYGAVVNAICTRVEQGEPRGYGGGSTFSFDIDETHPLKEDVLALFERFRDEASELRASVAAHNAAQPRTTPSQAPRSITLYLGAYEEAEQE